MAVLYELNAEQLPSGTVIVKIEKPVSKGIAIYARVSSNENKSNLDTQAERLEKYCFARGYQVVRIVKEVGSGVNDNRRKLIDLLNKDGLFHHCLRTQRPPFSCRV